MWLYILVLFVSQSSSACLDFGEKYSVQLLPDHALEIGRVYYDTINICNASNVVRYHELTAQFINIDYVSQNNYKLEPVYQVKDMNSYLLSVQPNSSSIFIIKFSTNKVTNRSGLYVANSKSTAKKLKKNFFVSFDTNSFFQSTFLGILVTMILLVLIYSYFLKHSYFRDYALYLVAIFIFFIIRYIFEDIFFSYSYAAGIFIYKISLITQCLFYVGYFSFVRSFLDTAKKHKKMDRLARYVVWFSFASMIILLCLQFSEFDQLGEIYFLIYRIVVAISATICIILGLRNWDQFVLYLSIGSGFLLIGSLMAMYYSIFPRQELLGLFPMYYMQTGMLVEFIFFNIGIGYKTYQLSQERLAMSNDLVLSLQENERLLRENETELKTKIDEITIQIKEAEKEQLETEFALKSKEMEMQILRSQINPHFMFNTINALKSLTMQHKYEEVGDYFDDFSKLLRLFLENSRNKKVSLEKELKALELYVKFENLRLRYKIKFLIHIDPHIDIHFTQIPPTIIQPFVENAIWHGLNPREKDGGEIYIEINMLSNEFLKIIVRDNGIGRIEAAKYKINTDHDSLAIKIIKERLALNNLGFQSDAIVFHDLVDDKNNAHGTEVVITVQAS